MLETLPRKTKYIVDALNLNMLETLPRKSKYIIDALNLGEKALFVSLQNFILTMIYTYTYLTQNSSLVEIVHTKTLEILHMNSPIIILCKVNSYV